MSVEGRSRISLTVAILALGATGCANERGPHPNLPPIGSQMEFSSRNLCSEGVSPQIRLGGVPSGTASYRLRLTNVSVLTSTRWEATVSAESPIIAEGAIANFDPPCPGEQQTFTYRLEIMALAADGQPLGYGWNFAQARSLSRQIDQEREELRQRATTPDRPPPSSSLPPFFIR